MAGTAARITNPATITVARSANFPNVTHVVYIRERRGAGALAVSPSTSTTTLRWASVCRIRPGVGCTPTRVRLRDGGRRSLVRAIRAEAAAGVGLAVPSFPAGGIIRPGTIASSSREAISRHRPPTLSARPRLPRSGLPPNRPKQSSRRVCGQYPAADRGPQYLSGDLASALARHGMSQSAGRVANCWDNSVVESFFSSLKRELVTQTRFAAREQARREIFSWIGRYNTRRIHSTLDFQTPTEWEVHHRQRLNRAA